MLGISQFLLVLFFCFVCISIVFVNGEGSASENQPVKKKVKSCKGLWRPNELVGKCFGLHETSQLEGASAELKNKKFETADDCRKLCCILEDKCVTWQWQEQTKKCLVGPIVRLGMEGCDSKAVGPEMSKHCGNWCEPLPPSKWNGRRVMSRDGNTGECTWGDHLPSQCFGLGPEKLKNKETKEKYNADECAMACCKDKSCDTWQEYPGRGCYFGATNHCEKYLGSYVGGRKCVRGHCGGMEKEILDPWLAKYAANEKG